MQIHSKITGIRGFVSVYNDALRFRDMITQKAEERARILAFRERYGDATTKEAFTVSRSTLYRWKKTEKEGNGKLEALVPKSTAPKTKRKRVIPEAVKRLIVEERSHERIGKEKLARLMKEDGIATLSPSTVGQNDRRLEETGCPS